ncbi:uncharacterized protein LOC135822812 isoform X2 [Sycon ciliatum]
MVWCVTWFLFAADSHAKRSTVRHSERTFIETSLATQRCTEASLWSALPYMVYLVLMPSFGRVADWLLETHLSATKVRKIFTMAA